MSEEFNKYIRDQRSKEYQEKETSKTYQNGDRCGCGNSKVYDASMCDECWQYQKQYNDSRDG